MQHSKNLSHNKAGQKNLDSSQATCVLYIGNLTEEFNERDL